MDHFADVLETSETQVLSSAHARLLVLELSVAALIAQLPQRSLEEITGLLCFVATSTEQAQDLALNSVEGRSLGHVGHWTREMLERAMNSRKASRAQVVSQGVV